ncbi:phage holin family protein [Roseovarius aestuarii]|nr:phage holin family protein [Roseovarius aestuarii]
MIEPDQPSRNATLISSVLDHLHRLIRKEMALIRSEVSQKLNRAAVAVGMITLAVIAVLTGLNVLAGACVALLIDLGLSAGWAALSVAGTFTLIGAILCLRGIHILKTTSLAPTETVAALKRDAQVLKESFHDP